MSPRHRNVKKALIVGGTAITAALCSAGMAFSATAPTLPDGAFAAPYPGSYFEPSGNFGVDHITGFYGSNAGQPGEPGQFQGHDTFTAYDTDGNEIGTFDALVGYNYEDYNPHFQMLVTGVHPLGDAVVGTSPGQLPQVGSVFDYGHSMTAPQWTYASLAGANSHDSTVATAGHGDVVHSDYPFFNASEHVDVHQLSPGDLTLPNGYYLVADPDSPEEYSGISNTAPFASTVQGFQVYNVVDPAHPDTVIGQVNAITISTADLVGGNSQEVFVTGYPDDAVGSDQASVENMLHTGSVINYLNYFGLGHSVYYALAGTGPGGSNDIGVLWNMFGMPFTGSTTFDAVKGFTDGTALFDKIPFVNGLSIVPANGPDGISYPADLSDSNQMTADGVAHYTGINGIPNGGVSGNNTDVQSFQNFVIDQGGAHETPFSAFVTDYGNGSVTDQAMFIHSIGQNTFGLQDGSTIEYADHGWFDTLTIDTNPTGLAAGDNATTDMLNIFGMGWMNIDPSSEWMWSLIGINF